MASRRDNAKRYKNWEARPDGGRRYWYDRRGAASGFQRIIKIVDANETILELIQEIYNDAGVLIERHQKYPVDTGHQNLQESE